ncbi:hypothetical protein NX059_003267 [Plenodomus lindquistii]|nr:hypothetical protein NX059_003267 [Plenodomus lindquistii]
MAVTLGKAKEVPGYKGFIQVCIGKEGDRETFNIHESIITIRSVFFKNAMSGNWKEAMDRKVSLPEDDANTFRVYVHLLYTGIVAVSSEKAPAYDDGSEEFDNIARLYVLAEKLQDVKAKNAAINAMLIAKRTMRINNSCCSPTSSCIQIVYAGIANKSPMRKLLVDIFVRYAQKGWHVIASEDACLPLDFYHDLTRSLVLERVQPKDLRIFEEVSKYMEAEPRS